MRSLPTCCPYWGSRSTTCPLKGWMRAPNNDGDDKEEEMKGAKIQVSVPDSGIYAYELI